MKLTSIIATLCLTIAASAAAQSVMPIGFDAKALTQASSLDMPAAYGSTWAGSWVQRWGWTGIEQDLRSAKAANAVPLVQWWYWGDDISPTCLENGCEDRYQGVFKDKATWTRLANELADLIVKTQGTNPNALVVVESEFNKNGIENYEPFDGYLVEQAAIFHARGIKVIVSFGNWNQAAWKNFDRAIAAADLLGTMTLQSSVRNASTYLSGADQLISAATYLKNTFFKETFVTDFAFSSYVEPDYESKQAAVITSIFSRMGELQAAGVRGMVWRMLADDPNFDTNNYHGMAERYWGLVRADGTRKAGFAPFLEGMKANVAATPVPAPAIDLLTTATLGLPVAGTTITSTETRFSWDRIPGAEMYWLDVGSSLGGREFYNASADGSASVTGYRLDGAPLYVRLWTLKDTVWHSVDYVFARADAKLQSVLTSPDPRGTLTSASTAFIWKTVSAADDYWFEVGTTPGGNDIYSKETTGTTATAPNIPLTGGLVYLRLWSRVSLTWRYVDYAVRTSDATMAVLTAPSPVSTINDASTRFAWSNASGADSYWLDIGTSPGGRDVYNSVPPSGSVTVSGYELNGQPLYVRLWTFRLGAWRYVDYLFTRADSATQARLTLPDRLATISSTSRTFSWNAISGAQQYWLYLGTSLGAPNLFNQATTATSLTVTSGIVLDGQPLYVRLWTLTSGGAWIYVDYVYQRANAATQATFTNITTDAKLTSTSFTFKWGRVSGAQQYWFDAGSSLGARDVANVSPGTATSWTLTAIQLNGQPLYVRLWTQSAAGWTYVDYKFNR